MLNQNLFCAYIVKEKLEKLMGVETGYKPIQESRSHLLAYLPQSQDELEPRSMKDSFTSALIPLSTEEEIQDRYITFLGRVRIGRLLEDMDIFAGKTNDKILYF